MHLGAAMDELMRHQPTLKTAATKAIIQVRCAACFVIHVTFFSF